MKNQIFYCSILFIFITILSCEEYSDTENINNDADSNAPEKILDIPDGFDFSTHQRVNLTINDPEEKIKYDVYNYSRISNDDEVELEYDEILIDNTIYKYIISGITKNGKISHTINLSKSSESICIRRKSNEGYEFTIIETNQNEIVYNYSSNNKLESTSNNSLSTTVIPATLSQDMVVSGNAIGSVGLNTNGYDLEVSGDLLLSGFIDLSNSNSTISANAIDFSGYVYLRGGTITSQTSVIISGWLDGSGTVNYCTLKSITGRLNTGGQVIQQQCGTDTDGDGVNDPDDAYPNDATKAGQIYSPNVSGKSTLAFEDLWPATGDYDFNDLSFSYRSLVITNAQNNAVQVDFICNVNTNYAGFTNGIGIELEGVTPSQVQSVTGTSNTEGYIVLNSNGTEANQTNAVIIFTDNADNFLEETTVSVVFNTPISTGTLGAAPFNPFIIANKDRAKEIHLANMEPTSLGESGTYITATGFPWGLSIINDNFKVPKEGVSILQAYNFFDEWAISGGVDYDDWNSNTEAGYRNNQNIED
jgi:LruC domain-containing protein